MQFISSDTNVWIDFVTIQKLEIPFRLPYTYIMSQYAVDDELLSPLGLGQKLLSYGLLPVTITIDEFLLAEEYGNIGNRKNQTNNSVDRGWCIKESGKTRECAGHGNTGHIGSTMGAAVYNCS